ncbi:Protein hyper-sensitivity-related 4 [Heracleum sosnowskyi]|uniref:Protein hyper-sensitivity-related 4 n=1 Tax=Heracleum sosnowskyi TaxID=360622 RepID=A0AAD8JM03_9APIA|nr:Protein hyper-sensitivity-related 4 [Heracleum sosnowskyi]
MLKTPNLVPVSVVDILPDGHILCEAVVDNSRFPASSMNSEYIPSAKAVVSVLAPLAASAMFIRSISNDFLPSELNDYLSEKFYKFFRNFTSEFTVVIEEFRGLSRNQVFEAADIYLATKVTTSTRRVKLGKAENEKNVALTVDKEEEVFDTFENIRVKWKLISTEVKSASRQGPGQHLRDLNATLRSEVRSYELSFHKKHKDKVLKTYLAHVMETSKAIKQETKAIKIRTVEYGGNWNAQDTNLDHPMTFNNLAMDSNVKNEIMEDLETFKKGKDFYKRIGRAWKRGYLLYGPPGTGKSSLIAAMANYLNFDIYDLDLTELESNSDLRRLLLTLSSRSILVIEDIDCSIKLQNRNSEDDPDVNKEDKVTLSGLLNFIDGLWSCCGEERIIVFTTNHIEKLDPALLRPGRMDMHIHMSYCTFSAFKQLAFNYLRILHHSSFNQIEELLKKADITPAEIAGELMKNTDSNVAIRDLLRLASIWLVWRCEEKFRVFDAVRISIGRLFVIIEATSSSPFWERTESALVLIRLPCYALVADAFLLVKVCFLPSSFPTFATSLLPALYLFDRPAMPITVAATGTILDSHHLYRKWTSSVLNLLFYNVLGGGLSQCREEPEFIVNGKVYCDTCRVQFPTRISQPINGARVAVECRDRENGTLTHNAIGKSDGNGEYNLPIKGDFENEICEVVVMKSPLAECAEVVEGFNRARISLTSKNGLLDTHRYANPLGFTISIPLPQCRQVLAELDLSPVD